VRTQRKWKEESRDREKRKPERDLGNKEKKPKETIEGNVK
jgi:hypothetical protein